MDPKVSPPQTYPQYDNNNGQPGMIVPGDGMFVGSTTLTLTAGRLYALRFMPSRNMSITKIKFFVGTAAGADDTCDVGIANASGTVLRTAGGAVAGKLNATSASLGTWTSVSLSSALTIIGGSVYYALFSCVTPFGGTAAVVRGPDTNTNPLGDPFGSAIGNRELGVQSGVGATIGASITLAQSGGVPFLVVSEV